MACKAYRVACNFVLGLLDADIDFAKGMIEAALYCQELFPTEDYNCLWTEEALLTEPEKIKVWLKQTLIDFPPPNDLVVIWLALACSITEQEGYIIDLCFAGDSSEERMAIGVCGPDLPRYLPATHLAHSKFLRELAQKVDKLSFQARFLSEYVLGMTYAVLLARDLAKEYASDLTGLRPRTIMAGFMAGDGIIIGKINARRFTLSTFSEKRDTAER
jgi:hypothetical protein